MNLFFLIIGVPILHYTCKRQMKAYINVDPLNNRLGWEHLVHDLKKLYTYSIMVFRVPW